MIYSYFHKFSNDTKIDIKLFIFLKLMNYDIILRKYSDEFSVEQFKGF